MCNNICLKVYNLHADYFAIYFHAGLIFRHWDSWMIIIFQALKCGCSWPSFKHTNFHLKC